MKTKLMIAALTMAFAGSAAHACGSSKKASRLYLGNLSPGLASFIEPVPATERKALEDAIHSLDSAKRLSEGSEGREVRISSAEGDVSRARLAIIQLGQRQGNRSISKARLAGHSLFLMDRNGKTLIWNASEALPVAAPSHGPAARFVRDSLDRTEKASPARQAVTTREGA